MYEANPSSELNALFSAKPWQGAVPDQAHFLFIGLDANYAAGIADMPIFARVIEYHEDGIAFWRRHGVHHPFLLPGYGGGGRRYHRNFSKIGFAPEHADQVSFVELLHVPTVGQSKLSVADLSLPHLHALNAWIMSGSARHVFVSAAVARLMQACGVFPWLSNPVRAPGVVLATVFSTPQRRVYQHYHFSVYGTHDRVRLEEAAAIGSLISGGPPAA